VEPFGQRIDVRRFGHHFLEPDLRLRPLLRALQVDPDPPSEILANCLCHGGGKSVLEQRPTPLYEILHLIVRERPGDHEIDRS
jgi:hypothetical protein